MIGSLRGIVEATMDNACVLDVNGVGYLVACSRKTLDRLTAREGAQKLLVETRVSQDAITLYGFLDASEREAFRALRPIVSYGDSDGDIKDTWAADSSFRAVRIVRTSFSSNPSPHEPGSQGEEILMNSAD